MSRPGERGPATSRPRTQSPASHFELVPVGKGAKVLLWVLCVILPLAITAAALGASLTTTSPEKLKLIAGSPAITVAASIGLIAVLTIPLAFWLHRALLRLSVQLHDGVLDLRAGWYHQRINVGELDPGKSRLIRWEEHTEFRPALKTNAIAFPGFQAGHFRLRDWRTKAFCILTSHEGLLALREHSGRVILLSLRQPQALLEALKQAVDSSSRQR